MKVNMLIPNLLSGLEIEMHTQDWGPCHYLTRCIFQTILLTCRHIMHNNNIMMMMMMMITAVSSSGLFVFSLCHLWSVHVSSSLTILINIYCVRSGLITTVNHRQLFFLSVGNFLCKQILKLKTTYKYYFRSKIEESEKNVLYVEYCIRLIQ